MNKVVTARVECLHGEVDPHPDLPDWRGMSPLAKENASQPLDQWCYDSPTVTLTRRRDYWGLKRQWVSDWEDIKDD